jgi:hypothetical protein
MLIILVLLILVLLITFILNNFKQSKFTEEQINFQNKLNPILSKINDVINSELFNKVKIYVPGLTNYVLVDNAIVQEITKGDLNELNKLPFPQILKDCDILTEYLKEIISMAQNSENVYTPGELQAFLVYYTNLLNNVNLIKNKIK